MESSAVCWYSTKNVRRGRSHLLKYLSWLCVDKIEERKKSPFKVLSRLCVDKIDVISVKTSGLPCALCTRRLTEVISPVLAIGNITAPAYHESKTMTISERRQRLHGDMINKDLKYHAGY